MTKQIAVEKVENISLVISKMGGSLYGFLLNGDREIAMGWGKNKSEIILDLTDEWNSPRTKQAMRKLGYSA